MFDILNLIVYVICVLLICFLFFRKENLINEERLKIIRELFKKLDIYERLVRVIGKNFIIIELGMLLNIIVNLK